MISEPRARRRGDTLLDWLLVATFVAVGIVVAAFFKLPDFERALAGAAHDLAARAGFSP